MEFIYVGWTDGNTCCYVAVNVGYWVWKRGIDRSRLADFSNFLSVFSNAFHILIDFEFVVSSLRYLPWGLSQFISTIFYEHSTPLSASNSLT